MLNVFNALFFSQDFVTKHEGSVLGPKERLPEHPVLPPSESRRNMVSIMVLVYFYFFARGKKIKV